MEPNNNLKDAIKKIFNEESDKNSVSEDFLVKNGINPESLIGDAELQHAKDAIEEEWLKKLIYDSIVAKSANDLALYKILNDEILEYCDVTENQTLLNKYIDLLIKFGG